MLKPSDPSLKQVNAEDMKELYNDHFYGLKEVSILRLVQAEQSAEDISARLRESGHVNDIAQTIIENWMMFQSPLQCLVVPVAGMSDTTNKSLFTDTTFRNKNVKFKVFGHQHFLAAMLIALEWAKDHNDADLVKRLSTVTIGIWVGLDVKEGKLLANIHNDVCHKIRQRDVWQLIFGLRVTYASFGYAVKEVEVGDGGLKRKDYDEMKKECFRPENVTFPYERNGLLPQWRTATLPGEVFTLLAEVNTMHAAGSLKGQPPMKKTQKDAQ